MQLSFSKQAALGLGAGVVAIGMLSTVWFSIPRPLPNPAKYVPAKETIAFFSAMTKTTAAPYGKNFPLLQRIPLSDTPAAVAQLKTGSVVIGWAPPTEDASAHTGFTIQTSDPAMGEPFTTVTNPLSQNRDFAVLMPARDAAAAWIRFPDIRLQPGSSVASLLKTDRPVSVSQLSDGLNVRFLEKNIQPFGALTTGPKDIFTHPLLILHVSNGATLMQMTSQVMQSTPLIVSETVVSNTLHGLFGKDFSMLYDGPALLQGPTSLHLATGNNGTLRAVLEGTLPGTTAPIDSIATLFRSNLATISKETQTFDEKFHWADVRENDAVVEDTMSSQNGWSVRSIRQKETGTVLLMALRGNRYILSNDETAFRKAVTTEAPALTGLDNSPAGLGLIDSSAWNDFLVRTTPTIWPGTPLPAGTGGYLKWKLMQDGSRMTIVLKKI